MANLLFVFIKKVIILGRVFGYCILFGVDGLYFTAHTTLF